MSGWPWCVKGREQGRAGELRKADNNVKHSIYPRRAVRVDYREELFLLCVAHVYGNFVRCARRACVRGATLPASATQRKNVGG